MININIAKSNKCNGEQSLFVTFPYDNKIVEIIRSFPTRYWDKEKKQWELPITKLDELKVKLSDYKITVNDNYKTLDKSEAKIPNGFKFKTKPFQHQIEGFNYGMQYNKWLLGDEQGLGKTKQVIDIAVAKKLQKGYKYCLIICGVNGLKWNWQNEIRTHSSETGYILGQRMKSGKLRIGSNKDKLTDLNNLKSISSYFLITNVETLRDDKISSKISELCKNKTIGIVAIDEIHKCFDYNTLITTDKGNLKIGDIVKNKLNVNVLTYNETADIYEYKPIKNWFENIIAEPFMELEIQTFTGTKTIRCTATHKFYTTNRGWVCAKDLTENDTLVEDTLYNL